MVSDLVVFGNLGLTVPITTTVDTRSAHLYLFDQQLIFSPHTMCQTRYEEPVTQIRETQSRSVSEELAIWWTA